MSSRPTDLPSTRISSGEPFETGPYPINEAAKVLEKVAAQDLRAQVEGQYSGDHAAIKRRINTMVVDLRKQKAARSLTEMAAQLQTLVGKFSV